MEIEPAKLFEILNSIPMKRIESSNVIGIGYNDTTHIMRVMFNNLSSYLYFDVEPEVYNFISTADSKGKALNEAIVKQKDKYKYYKI